MRSSSLIVAAACLIAVAGHARGECCPRTYMQWSAETCWPFRQQFYMDGGNEGDVLSSMILPTRCEAKACNDGRKHDGFYCGKGKCNVFGCNCDGGCIEGNPVANFRRINDIPHADGSAWFTDPTTWGARKKRSNAFSTVFQNSRAGFKLAKKAYDGHKEGQLSADTSRRDSERARNNAFTVPPPVTPSLVQRANQMYKPR